MLQALMQKGNRLKGQNNDYRLSDHGDRDITRFLRMLFYKNDIAEKKGHTDQSDGKREDGACEAY